MAIFDFLRRPLSVTEGSTLSLPFNPFQEQSGFSQIVLAEILGADVAEALPLSRAEALTVPAVAKARNLIVSQVARLPLIVLDKNGPLAEQPTWTQRTNTPVSPYSRMVCTVDDLIFVGLSLWRVHRGTKQEGMAFAPILAAEWIPFSAWSITGGEVFVTAEDGTEEALEDQDYILFDTPGLGGLLVNGARTIRGARDTERAWTSRIRNPSPILELHLTEESSLDEDETAELAKTWNIARRSPDGATAVTPPGVELNEIGTAGDAQLYIENRNAVRADVASFLGTRAAVLDGTTGQASLTYTTAVGEQQSFFGIDLPLWTDAIEAALSMDKVVPSGQRVRFDRTEQFTPTPTGAPVSD